MGKIEAVSLAILLTFSVVCVLNAFISMPGTESYVEGYAKGQIDALTGNVHYHLVAKPDSSKVWERIK
jgi:hypothetical protein